jgi:subtilase family serine protease
MVHRMTSVWPTIVLSALAAIAPASANVTLRLVTQPVDDLVTVELAGNTRGEANPENDRGRVEDTMPLEHLQLLLKRPESTEAELVGVIDELHDRNSPQFHHWFSAARFGSEFGPAAEDLAAVTGWLENQGMTVHGVQPSGMMIDFSGTAAQVGAAFHTEIHHLLVNGVAHIANMSSPRIPAALAGVVAGVVSLNDFRPHPNFKPRTAYTVSVDGGTFYAVVPADLATIYNLNPLFSAGISGQGQTVVVIEDTNVHSTNDWTTFRSKFGLNSYTAGSFTQLNPAGSSACANPGTVADNESEAELDAEWASAAAPSAAIVLASCKDTSTTFGGLLALQNLVNGSNPPAIVSLSYGECEADNGATLNAAFYTTYQQAVAEGTSVYVAAGDEGAASCDAELPNATHGIGVSAYASTPYNVAVGGTDFGDTYAGKNATYWKAGNTAEFGSARSYIDEIPWNDSCASVLITESQGFATPYGSAGFCNSTDGANYLTTASGGGGPSRCATGAPAETGVVGGTCQGYAKPSWQSLFGNPTDHVRDMPDVSLFAANGIWNHFYVYCDSDLRDGGASCKGAPLNWSSGGGTSFASPIWAGFQALVNQKQGAAQGNPNPTLYALAATEYGATGSTACNSSKGKNVASSCVFYDVTQGDMDVNCTGTVDCYLPSGAYGVLSTADGDYDKAYAAHAGWDFATGIGTVNVENLVNSW